MKFPWSTVSTGLVIRAQEVEVLSLRGKTVASRVCMPIEGREGSHIVQAIRKALAEASVETKRLAVSIPSREVLFRYFTIPQMPKQEWDAAVQFEARKYIPFKPETLVWDYRATASSSPDRLDVIFSAIPREAFSQVQELLTAADIQPTRIEPSSLSLARLLEPKKGTPSNEFVCLVDIEQDTAHLAIVKDRMPYLVRDISLLQSSNLPIPDEGQGDSGAGVDQGGVPPLAGI